MSWGSPLSFLLVLPALAAAFLMLRRRVRRGILFPDVPPELVRRRTWRMRLLGLAPWLTVAGLLLGVVALARPRTVLSIVRRTSDVIALEMVVDVSGSMRALDLSPKTATGRDWRTRLDVVKDTFARFIERRPEDLVGLVSFGGYASTRAPLTTDHDALAHVLKGVSIPEPTRTADGRVVDDGELLTAMGDALATACARLKDAEPASKIIVLLSDGESNTGMIEPDRAVEVAEKLGIKVYTIGVGTTTGRAPFKARDVFGREGIQYAAVRLDEALLKRIARDTGGQYFNVRDRDGLEEALADIDRLEKTEVEKNEYYQHNELFSRVLAPGIVLLVLGVTLHIWLRRCPA